MSVYTVMDVVFFLLINKFNDSAGEIQKFRYLKMLFDQNVCQEFI